MTKSEATIITPVDPTPRIALFIAEENVLVELEKTLRARYSSLLVITEREKLGEFAIPLLIIVDTIANAAAIRESVPVAGTQILVVAKSEDSESSAAAFDAGATDYLGYPFSAEDVIAKTEKYLEPFRQAAR